MKKNAKTVLRAHNVNRVIRIISILNLRPFWYYSLYIYIYIYITIDGEVALNRPVLSHRNSKDGPF